MNGLVPEIRRFTNVCNNNIKRVVFQTKHEPDHNAATKFTVGEEKEWVHTIQEQHQIIISAYHFSLAYFIS